MFKLGPVYLGLVFLVFIYARLIYADVGNFLQIFPFFKFFIFAKIFTNNTFNMRLSLWLAEKANFNNKHIFESIFNLEGTSKVLVYPQGLLERILDHKRILVCVCHLNIPYAAASDVQILQSCLDV